MSRVVSVDSREAGALSSSPCKRTNVGTKEKKATCWIHRSRKGEILPGQKYNEPGKGRNRRIASYRRDELVAQDTPKGRCYIARKTKESMTPRGWSDIPLDRQVTLLQ
jgi:hypothetical protein